ncbi:MAG: DUF6100 family protein [Lachnospiraceae bacterium]|nr:DUF6100 family protein [Lachnospiraceae bacterium]
MEKSNTTKRQPDYICRVENNGNDRLQKQLDYAQRLAGEAEQRIAEARGILRSCQRRGVGAGEDLNTLVLEAEKNAEFLTDRLRALEMDLSYGEKTTAFFQKEIVNIHGITVDFADGILSVSLPALLPHRKTAYTDYLYKPLSFAIRDWRKKRLGMLQEMPFFERATVCFYHDYDRNRDAKRIRDHDNIEEKQVLDLLAGYFLQSDSGLYLNTYHETRQADADRTRIFLMKSDVFPSWLASQRMGTEHIEKNA